MYKDCRTEQSAQRQRQLEMGLLEMMKTRHFDEVSISDLCDKLEIPRKSFYRYFSGKEGALYALLDHTLMEYETFSREFNRSGQRTVRRELEAFFRFWLCHRSILDAMAHSKLRGLLVERAVLYALEEEMLPDRFSPSDSKQMQRQITMFCVFGLMSMVFTWHGESFATPPEEMAVTATRIISQPLFPGVDKFM